MTTTSTPISGNTYRLPVIIQTLPDLGDNGQDWTSQQGREIAIGSITVGVLNELFEVDRLNQENPNGYQRIPTMNRVNSLKRDLNSCRVDLPTAILLNLREYNPAIHLSRFNEHSELALQSGDKLYIVDGQHRVEALIALYKDEPNKWGTYAIPFVCLLGADRDGELTEFYVVNDNAKSIDTGLALELLKRRADNSDSARAYLVETGKAWMRDAVGLTHKLEETEIWRGRILAPGQSKAKTLITNNGMVTSLRPLVDQPGYFKMSGEEQQVKILNAYWEGMKKVAPDVFNNPEKYNLQRTLGVIALHAVLVNVLAIIGSQGKSVLDSDNHASIMEKPLNELGGYNKQGEWVVGTDFWKRGNEGASGLFSSRSGYRILQAQITENLPSVIVQ